jgi:hypothetical protein
LRISDCGFEEKETSSVSVDPEKMRVEGKHKKGTENDRKQERKVFRFADPALGG